MNTKMQAHTKTTLSPSSFTPASTGLLQRKCACGNHTMAGSECAECGKTKRFGLQTKLKINEPGDTYEREADRIADQVMATPAHSSVSGAPPRIQRYSGQSNGLDAAPASVDRVLASPGRPLDTALKDDMGRRFGHDFSRVRVHSGAAAEQSAREVNAYAYTVGHNVVFGAGRFAPETEAGQHLLAHELTHVMQQRGSDASGVVHRQPNPQNPNPNPPPAPLKFQANVDCIVEKTNEQIPVDPNTVTVIEYGATWCQPCGKEQQFLIELCKEYKAAKTAVPVRFFLVDATDEDVKPTIKTWPPVPNSMPGLLIYSGKFQTFQALGLATPTKAEAKAQIDIAIGCAKDPLKCPALEEPAGGPGCKIDTGATPKGTRFKFNVNTVEFASGEEAKLNAFVKKIKPKSTIDLLGLASSDGSDSGNKILSCQRALTATSVFARNSLLVDSMKGSGSVPGTDNKPEYRAVDVQVTDPAAPAPQVTPPGGTTTTGTCSAPTCVADFVISGLSTIQKGRLITDPAATPADPRDKLQTSDCNPSLYQIAPGGAITSNVKILHVTWKKDPPPGTKSVLRTASDDTGDNPDPNAKAPSFAALDPTTGAGWAKNVDSVAFRSGCKTTKAAPSWCVPFCSFGKFTMVATVTWQCGTMICSNDFKTQPLTIDVQPTP